MATETFTGTGSGFADLTWTQLSGLWSRSSDQGTVDGSFVVRYARCESDAGSADMYAEVEWVTGDSANDRTLGVGVRYDSAADTGYFLEVNDQFDRYIFYRRNAGVDTSIIGQTAIGGGVTPGAGKKIRLEAQGTTLRGYWDGNLLFTQTDSNITTGSRGGLESYNSNGVLRFDNFATGALGVAFTGAVATTASLNSTALVTGMTGSRATTFGAASGALLLGAAITGTRATTTSITAGLSVTSRVFTGTLEVELTAGVWTDFSSRVALRVAPVRIAQGRPSQYDPVGPGRMTLALWNDDGNLMPDNASASYYPHFVEGKRIRWKVTKGGVTYTRFTGWIQEITPDFPGDSTYGATVGINAVDALGLLSQRKFRSIICEAGLWRARNDGYTTDIVEFVPVATGLSAAGTNYSQDASPGVTGSLYNSSWPTLGFSSAPSDVNSEGILTANPDSNFDCNMTKITVQANCKYITYLWKTPRDLISTATAYFVASFQNVSSADIYHIAVAKNGTANALFLMDAAGTGNLGIIANLPFGAWVRLEIYPTSGNPSSTTTTVAVQYFDGTEYLLGAGAVDMRSTHRIILPASIGPKYEGDYGTVMARGGTTTVVGLPQYYCWPASAAAIWTLSYRASRIADWTNQLPVSWTDAGTPSTTQAATGNCLGKTALEETQTTMGSARGLAWARPWDGTIVRAWSGALRPASPVATISTDADCAGSPRLSRSVTDRPTRIEMTFPGGSVLAIDATAEAGGAQRSRSLSCHLADAGGAQTLAGQVLADGSGGTRITQVTVDLTTGATDHTAVLLSESGTLGGLYPLQRVRLGVPSSHFGASTVDALVQGWEETYAAQGVTIQLDTTPA